MSRAETYSQRFQDSEKALKYATRFERGTRRGIDQREQSAVRKIFSRLPDCHSLLDVPSGAGRFLANLGREPRWVIEMDVAFEILQFARERAEREKHRASFLQANAASLPLRDGAVDGIFCNRLLHHLPSITARAGILRELSRVARRYVVVSFFDYLAFGGLRRFLKRLKGRKVDYTGQPTLEQFCSEVTACGFRVREVLNTGPFWVAEKYLVLEKSDRA